MKEIAKTLIAQARKRTIFCQKKPHGNDERDRQDCSSVSAENEK